jgi:hypothetical protein
MEPLMQIFKETQQLIGQNHSGKPFFNVNKILLDSYQEASAGGSDTQKHRQISLMHSKGALIFNYLGHGGEDGLSSERIWEKSDGQNLSNQYKVSIVCYYNLRVFQRQSH